MIVPLDVTVIKNLHRFIVAKWKMKFRVSYQYLFRYFRKTDVILTVFFLLFLYIKDLYSLLITD